MEEPAASSWQDQCAHRGAHARSRSCFLPGAFLAWNIRQATCRLVCVALGNGMAVPVYGRIRTLFVSHPQGGPLVFSAELQTPLFVWTATIIIRITLEPSKTKIYPKNLALVALDGHNLSKSIKQGHLRLSYKQILIHGWVMSGPAARF